LNANDNPLPPILSNKDLEAKSAFTPESLLREARRQKRLELETVPKVCLLDPDGDVVRHFQAAGRARRHDGWACYHTDLFVVEEEGIQIGLVGCAVGAAFAVLVAEELFASGCELLVSVTSAGQIAAVQPPPYFVLIDRALRDEGASYHYLPPSDWSEADGAIIDRLSNAFENLGGPVLLGPTWTTDAPFRETEAAIDSMRRRGILAVEMEAAALYAFARARGRAVVCFAHVTNQMGRVDGDFEKGEADGAALVMRIARLTAERLGRLAPLGSPPSANP
jgi:uridine phosphorylase